MIRMTQSWLKRDSKWSKRLGRKSWFLRKPTSLWVSLSSKSSSWFSLKHWIYFRSKMQLIINLRIFLKITRWGTMPRWLSKHSTQPSTPYMTSILSKRLFSNLVSLISAGQLQRSIMKVLLKLFSQFWNKLSIKIGAPRSKSLGCALGSKWQQPWKENITQRCNSQMLMTTLMPWTLLRG